MNTVIGTILDSAGNPVSCTVTFVSQSTPTVTVPPIIIANTTLVINTNPSDGTFSQQLEPGQYQVTFGTPNPTVFTIVVPTGSGTVDIDDIISSPIPLPPGPPPYTLWNGQWAGTISFVPTPAPAAPTQALVAYTGGNINAAGNENYSYWVSYVTASGETNISPALNITMGATPTANKANRITVVPNVENVTAIHIWRTYVDTGSPYSGNFPAGVSLLATLSASASFYDDYESTAQFAGRQAGQVPPIYNSTAGQVQSSIGNTLMIFSDQAIYFPGTSFRIKPGYGPQWYDQQTGTWFTMLHTGGVGGGWAADGGNPN